MEFPTFITKVAEKIAPASKLEQEKVKNGAQLWYEKLIKNVQDKKLNDKPLNFLDKAIDHLDQWYALLVFDFLFVFVINYIQSMMHPDGEGSDELEPPR